MQSGAGGLPQPFWSPHESQLTGWGCNNQTKPRGSRSPATQDGPCPFMLLLVIPHVPFLPLGPSTLAPRRRGNAESAEDRGGRGEGPLGPPRAQEVSPLTSCSHGPLSLPTLPRPPSAASNQPISLSVLGQSRGPTEMSLPTQNSPPTVSLPQDSYLPCLPGKQFRKRYGKMFSRLTKVVSPRDWKEGRLLLCTLHISEFLQRESAAFEIKSNF